MEWFRLSGYTSPVHSEGELDLIVYVKAENIVEAMQKYWQVPRVSRKSTRFPQFERLPDISKIENQNLLEEEIKNDNRIRNKHTWYYISKNPF